MARAVRVRPENVTGFGPMLRCPEATGIAFRVYNRYGELVFTGDTNNHWDGTFKGEPAQLDVFVWILEYVDPDIGRQMKTGPIAIIR